MLLCSQSTSLCLLSLLHRSTLSSTKKRRVWGGPRKKRFYCVNYLEVKAGWDSSVLYRQERVILMSGDVRGYFSSFLPLLLCFNTSASSRSHRKLLLWAVKTDFSGQTWTRAAELHWHDRTRWLFWGFFIRSQKIRIGFTGGESLRRSTWWSVFCVGLITHRRT